MAITPWELLHTLGRATILSGQGSSRNLGQHWAILRYITSFESNTQGKLILSEDGNNPSYHRKSVQAEDLGIAFALSAALRVCRRRHPGVRFEIVDADAALEAGWTLRGAGVKNRVNTLLRPDYFLVGLRGDEPAQLITVECKGSHGRPEAQHLQLAKAAAQVNSIVLGDPENDAMSPPSLLLATSLGAASGIEIRMLDPDGPGTLMIPNGHSLSLNGPVAQLDRTPGIPALARRSRGNLRPGFFIPVEQSEWFSRVLARTSAAGLLTFIGDRKSARSLLTRRQRNRVGSTIVGPGTDALFDAGIELGGLTFVGTDHVFRFGSQRIEAFSGALLGIHQLLANGDLRGYQAALPAVTAEWNDRRGEIEDDWNGVIAMDEDGAVLGLRPIDAGRKRLIYPEY